MELHGRVALVTGAGRRVGRALAVALGAKGMRVAVHYRGSRSDAEETATVIGAAGGEAALFAADLAERGAADRLVRDVAAHFGALDVLVNSAAVMERTPIGEVTEDAWDAMFALNLRAPFFAAQAAASVMPDRAARSSTSPTWRRSRPGPPTCRTGSRRLASCR